MSRVWRSLVVCFATCGSVAGARGYEFTELRSVPVQMFECPHLLATSPRVRMADLERASVMAWNVEGVEQLVGKFRPAGIDPRTGRYRFSESDKANRLMAPWKFAAKQRHILNHLPQVIVASEVESREAADRLFNTELLEGRYRTFFVEGNDLRGIAIAFAVRADLDVDVEVESHAKVRWFDEILGSSARVFTRDLPALILRDGETGSVELVVLGQHAKSMRDRAGERDLKSTALRRAQFAASRWIAQEYLRRFPDVPLVMAGDFNVNVLITGELDPLHEILHETFELCGTEDRVTQTHHPRDAPMKAEQLDAVFVSDALRKFVVRSTALPEFDHVTGEPLGQPRSLEERSERFMADHRAVLLELGGHPFARPR